MNQNEISTQFVDDIVLSDISKVAIDFTEVGLDTFLDPGIVRDVPVIGTIINLAKAGLAIRDRLFIRKVGTFLLSLQNISQAEKETFYKKLNQDPILKKKVGETLIMVLDRLDDLDKPQIVAKVFEVYITGKVSFDEFKRISSAIDSAFIEDLKSLIVQDELDAVLLRSLMLSGLTAVKCTSPTTPGHIGIGVELTYIGELYIKILKDAL